MSGTESEEVVEVPGRVCDACKDHTVSCRWPTHDRWKTCERCSEMDSMQIKKVAVSKCPLRRRHKEMGGSVHWKVGIPEWKWSGLEGSCGGMEKVLWE